MNIFKNLILAFLISTGFTDAFAMEEGITKEAPTTGPDFPVDIWGEIVKQIINDKELSLEQKAKKLNDLIITSKNAKTAVDNWVDKLSSTPQNKLSELELKILHIINSKKLVRDIMMDKPKVFASKNIKDIINQKLEGPASDSITQKAMMLYNLRLEEDDSRYAVDYWIETTRDIKDNNDLEFKILQDLILLMSIKDIRTFKKKEQPLLTKIDRLLWAGGYSAARELLKHLSDFEKQSFLNKSLFTYSEYISGRHNNKNIINFLIKEGANPNFPGDKLVLNTVISRLLGNTFIFRPKEKLLENPQLEIFEELLKNGANPNLPDKNNNNLTPLEYAKKLLNDEYISENNKKNIKTAIKLMEEYSIKQSSEDAQKNGKQEE